MAYDKRFDGRAPDETRPMTAKAGVVPQADGSAMLQIGKTTAIAAVYGPRELHPKFRQNPKTGLLRCHYSMMPFSGHGERVRPGQNRRAKEISRVMERALRPVINLSDYPNAVVDVFVELPQTDAGTRCAGITAAAMALADAGFEMKDMIAAVAIGFVDDRVVADLTYMEEHYNDYSAIEDKNRPVADIPVAMMVNSGKVTLLQADGLLQRGQLNEALKLCHSVCKKVYEVQKKALKARYQEVAQ